MFYCIVSVLTHNISNEVDLVYSDLLLIQWGNVQSKSASNPNGISCMAFSVSIEHLCIVLFVHISCLTQEYWEFSWPLHCVIDRRTLYSSILPVSYVDILWNLIQGSRASSFSRFTRMYHSFLVFKASFVTWINISVNHKVAPATTSKPRYEVSMKACKRYRKDCVSEGIPMKWTGTGCKNKKGKKMGDGAWKPMQGILRVSLQEGMQNKDKECVWQRGQCFVRATKYLGTAVTACQRLT